jgi:hypothetical protein
MMREAASLQLEAAAEGERNGITVPFSKEKGLS